MFDLTEKHSPGIMVDSLKPLARFMGGCQKIGLICQPELTPSPILLYLFQQMIFKDYPVYPRIIA